jgi:hypothetical protein
MFTLLCGFNAFHYFLPEDLRSTLTVTSQETLIALSHETCTKTLLLKFISTACMDKIAKSLSLLLAVILALSSLVMLESATAQISKPSVPKFTLTLQNNLIVLTIENQPFDASSNCSFYYDVRIMNVGGYWSSLYKAENGPPTQSNSNSTTLYYPIAKSDFFPSLTTVDGIPIPPGEATFQVMAMIGNWEKTTYSDGTVSYGLKGGEVSGWSGSQTITLPSTNAPSPTVYVSPMGGMSTSYRLTMFSPNEHTLYDNVLPLEFMLVWTYDLLPLFEPKTDYAYSIDGNPFVGIAANSTSNDRPGGGYTFVYNPSFAYWLDISNLTNGRHEIVIRASFNFGHLLLNDSSTPFAFTVQNSNPRLTPSSTPTPAPTPTVPELSWLLMMPLLIGTLAVAMMLGHRKTAKLSR